MWPRGSSGCFDRVNRSAGPAESGAASARFSASVLPVTVMQSPCRKPRSSRYFMTPACRRPRADLPARTGRSASGRRAAARDRSRAGSRRATAAIRAARAIAIRCSTALVDPPTAMTIANAFSNDFRVRMSSGLRSRSRSALTAAPRARHSSTLPGSSAGIDELYGSDSPSASIATAIVFAVYMPPQAPAPGHAWRTMSTRCSSVMTPARYSPYD